jgi:hypothetical protein
VSLLMPFIEDSKSPTKTFSVLFFVGFKRKSMLKNYQVFQDFRCKTTFHFENLPRDPDFNFFKKVLFGT